MNGNLKERPVRNSHGFRFNKKEKEKELGSVGSRVLNLQGGTKSLRIDVEWLNQPHLRRGKVTGH